MSRQPLRLRRCQLSVPASSEKMLAKAAGLRCDSVIIDLEDAVAPGAKVQARGQAARALNEHDWQARAVSVRVNDVTTPWCHDDIIEVVTAAGGRLATLVLAKTSRVQDVIFVHMLLDQLECKLGLGRRIGIECLIEDVQGLQNVDTIAACSDRLESLILGLGDYAASQRMPIAEIGAGSDSYPGDIWYYPRFRLTAACRANGLDPIDGPLGDFRNPTLLDRECAHAAALGMGGKWAIHPDQIAVIEAAFSPDPARVAEARAQKQAYEQACARGEGAISVDGVMVDAATVRMLQPLLDLADLIG